MFPLTFPLYFPYPFPVLPSISLEISIFCPIFPCFLSISLFSLFIFCPPTHIPIPPYFSVSPSQCVSF